MTDVQIELPRVLTDSCYFDPSIFPTLRHMDPRRRLWFAYTHSFVPGTDKMSVPNLCRPIKEAVQHPWHGEDVESWESRAGLYPAYVCIRAGQKYRARLEKDRQW